MYKCNKCKKLKQPTEFYKDNSKKNGLRSHCKTCVRKYNRAWVKANFEERKAYRKNYYLSNKEEISLQKKSLNGKYIDYRTNAKKRNIPFNLTIDDFEIFWDSDCSYCGQHIDGVGIDRIDSSKGYELSNCTPCCATCNKMKLDYNEQDWYNQMLLILKNQGII